MSVDHTDFSSMENGDVDSFWAKLSNSERSVLSETLQQIYRTNGEVLAESEFCDLQNMKEWSGNEGARESGSGGGGNSCASSVTSSAPGGGGGVMDLQPIHEDQSLFFELVQKDSASMEDSHDLQIFQGQGLVPEFNTLNTNLDHIFDLYHPVEKTLAVGDWLSTPSFLAFEGRSPGEAEPTLQSYPTNGSLDLLGVISDSDKAVASPSSSSVASQRSQFDFSVQNNLASGTTLVPIQEVMNSIQVVKTECHREDEWPASEVSEGEFDAKKKERRRQQNRTAARRCRNRKKETFEIMFKAAQKAKLENVELVKEVIRLREKLKSVVQLVKVHETNCGFQLTTAAAISQLRRPVASAAGER